MLSDLLVNLRDDIATTLEQNGFNVTDEDINGVQKNVLVSTSEGVRVSADLSGTEADIAIHSEIGSANGTAFDVNTDVPVTVEELLSEIGLIRESASMSDAKKFLEGKQATEEFLNDKEEKDSEESRDEITEKMTSTTKLGQELFRAANSLQDVRTDRIETMARQLRDDPNSDFDRRDFDRVMAFNSSVISSIREAQDIADELMN